MTNQTIVIAGASSDIAKALAKIFTEMDNNTDNTQLIIISRDVSFYQQNMFKQTHIISVENYEEQAIASAVNQIKNVANYPISQVYMCHGVLHNERCIPEKRLENFSADAFTEILTANTITPMLWLKHLTPILTGKSECKVVVFTARVGSISDNRLGGWYSYRASKAAMNMLLKSAAIELRRRAKNIKLISFHPGTTDTPLSKPFQKNVPAGKLFTSEFVANQLISIVDNTPINGEASYVDWQGKDIPW